MTAALTVATSRQVRVYLWTALRSHRKLLLATILVLLLASSVALMGPLAIGRITQAVVDGRPVREVVIPAIGLAAATLVAAVATWAGARMLASLLFPVVADLRSGVVASVLDLPIDRIEDAGTGDLLSRVTDDVETVAETSQGILAEFAGAALTILITIAGLASLDWRFAVAGLLAVPIQAHTLRWYLRVSGPVFAAAREAAGRRTAALLGSFGALSTIRAYRMGERRQEVIAETSTEVMRQENAVMRMSGRFYGRLNLAEYIGLASILGVSYWLVTTGVATVGEATSAALFFAALFNPINIALGVFDEIQAAAAGLARLVGILGQPEPAPRPLQAPPSPAVVEAKSVSFAYHEDFPVLHDVDLRLAAGTCTAIVGTTGSGKTTVASLLAGLRRPSSGAVMFGDRPLLEIDQEQLHQAIPMVAQEVHVFVGTVNENLRLAAPEASGKQLTQALTAVGAAEWVSRLPQKSDTVVGAGGHELTTAQAQHLALARVLLLDPAVVILDEATAEAGSDAGRILDQAARAVISGRTALVVAHRLSQAAAADRVIVMDHGRIVEDGTHAELLERRGRYRPMWSDWSGAGAK